jgi:predicted ATPase/DNA-binding SARP family transcriptional activator
MVWDEDGEPVRIREAKVRTLLAALLVRDGRTVSADRLIDELWGGRPPANAANALQAKVSQLRGAIGRDRVVYQPPGYRLALRDEDEVDAELFRSLMARAREIGDPRARIGVLSEASGLWRAAAYADFADEEFTKAAAHRLDEERLILEEELAEARLEAGDHARLAGELDELVTRHPLRERLRLVQMKALYRAGRQSEALASYARLRELLAEELGADPGPELAALHEAILRQDAPLRPESTAPATGRAGNLPVSLTPLIGRDHLLDEVERLLHTVRLVTLTGPGGVGKTRLAVAAAERFATSTPYEVWLVELAGHRGGAADLAQVVAATLGLPDSAPSGLPTPPEPPDQRLAAVLRDRAMLLVLDNSEHVVEAAAELVARLLHTAPGVRVLATGRESLAVEGEQVRPVVPLDLPDAMELFTARAAAASPGFRLDDANREAVAEICRRLDGIPLALELAATRVHALGVDGLAEGLGDRFRLLTSGRRDAPARQRTLRAVLDWSWELLDVQERAVLRRLAVHHGSWTMGAATAVCADDLVRREDVPKLVAGLVDRSLVTVVDRSLPTRFRLLESVAAYALERLDEAEESDAVRGRHLDYYLRLAEQAEPADRSITREYRLERLDADAADLRAALDEAIRRDASGRAAGLATALPWWWLRRGRLNEARRMLSAVCDAVPSDPEPRLLRDAFTLLTGGRPDGPPPPDTAITDPRRRGRAVWLYAYALFHGGEPASANRFTERALTLCTEARDRWGIAAAQALQAMLALLASDLDKLERTARSSAAAFRELGDRWGELQAVMPLASLAVIKADYEEAARLHEEGMGMAMELDLPTVLCDHISGLGRVELLRHNWESAHGMHGRAYRHAVAHGYVYGAVHAMMGLALGARRSGELDEAESYLQDIRDAYGGVSSQAGDHLMHSELGFIAELRGDPVLAADHHRKGWKLARAMGDPRAQALSLEGLAGAASLTDAVSLSGATGHVRDAAVLLGAADAARRGVGAPLPQGERLDVDRITERATAALGESEFEAAFQAGAALAPEQAVRYA